MTTTSVSGPLSSRVRTAVVGTLIVAAIAAGGWMLHRGVRAEVAPPLRGTVLFDQVRSFVAERYIDSMPESRLYQMAVDGMVSELGDPYSVFLTPDRVARLTERTSGTYAGIGLQVDVRDGFLFVVNPLPGGPGERAGIMTGDRIVEIDGKVIRGWTPDEVQRLLRGPQGSSVVLTVEHPGQPTPIRLKLERAFVHQSAVRTALMLPNSVAYITIRMFSDSTASELRRSIDSLIAKGAKSLVIDVRGNPGGLLRQGVHVADLFLDSAQRIVSTHGRMVDDNRDYVDSTKQVWANLPLVVLVDERTASAAELFAGALQDNDRAAVLGVTTFGKGSAQNVFSLGTEGALKLTTARWYTPLGRSIARVDTAVDTRSSSGDKRPKYKTPAGRTVLGGGGITPDVTVLDTTITPENLVFMQTLGMKVGQFRDALASYALSVKTSKTVTSPTFVVTQVMLDDVYRRMTERGVTIPRVTYDDARSLVARLLSYEISRYVFGAEAELYRKTMDDRVVNAAEQLLRGLAKPQDVFKRAERLANVREPDRDE